jgi:4-oxalocrotonate tautomerase
MSDERSRRYSAHEAGRPARRDHASRHRETLAGESEKQRTRLAEAIAKDVMDILGYGEESVSVAFEEISPKHWAERVYRPDIVDAPARLDK